MRGRALFRPFLLALFLLLPGTPAIVAQQRAAQALFASPQPSATISATCGTPPEDRLHFASLPAPSGAEPAYPLNHSFDGQSQSLGALVPNADFETAGTTVGTPPTNSDFSASSTIVGTPPTNADFESGTLSGWTTTGSPVIASDGSHDAWAKLSSGAAITSAPSTVDANAQVFSFELNDVTSGSALSVSLLSGATTALPPRSATSPAAVPAGRRSPLTPRATSASPWSSSSPATPAPSASTMSRRCRSSPATRRRAPSRAPPRATATSTLD